MNDNIKSPRKEQDLKVYEGVIREEKYKNSINVGSLRVMNAMTFEKSKEKELANCFRFN